MTLVCFVSRFQAQSEDDDTGPDDVAVTVEAQDGYMEAFFAEVTRPVSTNKNQFFVL